MARKDNTKVYLEPIQHVYIHKESGDKFTSVTKVISSIEPEFDAENISEAISKQSTSKRNPKYKGMSKLDILEIWQKENEEANMYGTMVHEIVEDYLMANKFYFPKNDFEKSVLRAYDELNIDEGREIFPERIMFSAEFKLAGMTDLLVDVDDELFDIGDWKGLSINTPIFTDSGWKTMGTISKSDKVYDMNGQLTKISHISSIKNTICYEIKFDNNETIIADFEHRWLVSFLRYKKFKDVVMTTEELYVYMNELNSCNKKSSHKIPKVKICKPLINNNIDLPIDPYLLGVWLGDGHKADNKITNMNDAIWAEIEKRGYTLGPDISQGGAGKAQTRTVHGIHSKLKKLNLLFNKHLPDIYLRSSYEQRLDVLRGFMDADGYYNKSRKRFVMSTTQEWQIIEFVKLTSSLGIKTTILPYKKKLDDQVFDAYDICFSTESLNPFLCRNQIDIKYGSRNNKKNFKNIISINPVESTPTRCIEVESKTKTFLYSYTFSITHNTNKEFNYYSKYKTFLLPPFDYLQNCQYVIYTLQLSIYALMYEMETGKKCRQLWAAHFNKETLKFTKIPLIYMKNEAKKLLKFHQYQTQLKEAV